MLQSLNFRVHIPFTVFNEAAGRFTQIQTTMQMSNAHLKSIVKEAGHHLVFLCYLESFSLPLQQVLPAVRVAAIVQVSLGILQRDLY